MMTLDFINKEIMIMAVGFTQDGAVQDQIDDTVNDAVLKARAGLVCHNVTEYCVDCDEIIPAVRRKAIPNVECCIGCQSKRESSAVFSGMNRKASKDSLLR